MFERIKGLPQPRKPPQLETFLIKQKTSIILNPKPLLKLEGSTVIQIQGSLSKLTGRKSTTLDELNAIGVRKKDAEDIELTDKEIQRINEVRNGYDSVEEFLNADPKEHQGQGKEWILFSSDRVDMTVDGSGDVSFKVDKYFDVRKTEKDLPKPTKDLVQMAKHWEKYVDSPAGKRIFTNVPYEELNANDNDNRFEARKNTYEKFGFKARKFYYSGEGVSENVQEIGQIFDNRNPKQTLDAETFYDGLGMPIQELANDEDFQKAFKDMFIELSKQEKTKLLKSKSANDIIKNLKIDLPNNWENDDSDDPNSLISMVKTLKTVESNLNPNNKGIDGRMFFKSFPEEFLADLEEPTI